MRGKFGAIALIVLAFLVMAGVFAFVGGRRYTKPGPLDASTDVVVPRGGLVQVADALRQAGVIDQELVFRVAAVITRQNGPLRAAEFAFPAHASIADVLSVMRTAKPVQHHVTIPEGLTAPQIAEILNKAPAMSGTVATPPEGSVLPETYDYEWNTPRAAILRRAQKAMDRTLDTLWASRPPGLPLATSHDALVLASIVEHETGKPDERPHIAAVFLNRLRLGMKLQSDPTVIYGLIGDQPGAGGLDRKLTRADLERDSPYNTYLHTGLPPGPIDSPGIAALRAVVQPSASSDLYFVADGTGGHVFAETLEGHERNVARYRALMAGQPPFSVAPVVAKPAHAVPRHPVGAVKKKPRKR